MGIRDFINSLKSTKNETLITWRVDPREGIDFIMDRKVLSEPERFAMQNPHFGMQLAYLKGMAEQSKAVKNSNGFTIMSADAVELGDDFISLFDFPDLYSGKYLGKFDGNTGKSSFKASIDLLMKDGSIVQRYSVCGPFLKLAENEMYMLTPADWRALTALSNHRALSPEGRGEYENNWLVFQLQFAKRSGMAIDLAHFNNLEIISPDAIGISIDALTNGDIVLTPSFGSGIGIDDIKARLGQISDGDEHCILRVKNKFVLLDEKRLEATKEILTNQRIPKEQVSSFLKSPTAYLNAALVDLDTGFSLRVHGAERFSHRYFGDVEKSGVDWFSKASDFVEPPEQLSDIVDSAERLEEVELLINDALKTGAQLVEIEDRIFDISDENKVQSSLSAIRSGIEDGSIHRTPEEPGFSEGEENATPERAVVAIDSNDDSIEFSKDARATGLDLAQQTFERGNLKRLPYPHQEEGICWMLAHLDHILQATEVGGALLADDMGLGKTYMTLVAIAEWYLRCKKRNMSQKPTLIVAPLSLIENWQAEVDATFNKSPFTDMVVLQSGAELSRYRIKGAGRETLQEFPESYVIQDQDKIRYALKVGGVYGSERLDLPSRLVLTTYQTLRDYQFSLSRIDWSVVAFDEAQNLKNPNALATRAAKGLKADFKLLATGTPVENSLKDFWCLFDTAVPGLLGAWQDFRRDFIAPILAASPESLGQVRLDVGRQLRSRVGDYMLRRTKAEKLEGLPEKRIFSGDKDSEGGGFLPILSGVMSGSQLAYYDEIIAKVKCSKPEDKRSIILPSLRRLKVASIHHDIDARSTIPSAQNELLKQAQLSAKIQSLVAVLKEIEKRSEKVLVFVETKAVQAYVCALVTTIFRIPVEIINGETKAVATKQDSMTRKAIIDRFQSEQGFGVIVMSPVAAGVGLTVVGANNVIHLERHWNPAKEAQATDRVYRIGQEREVNVYIPMALHPSVRSFDQQLNGLLANKVDLSDAVVANQSIEANDLAGCF
ncbi:DEAD/DEAH box helicase [Haliea salexigens]|uniref:DEAD/DEAH box helicase n=1 Tax=Haliea salexigens TaxID=287487 RepID=UPI000421CEA2|nr:DEAD/DEAH box helicase [Haliea salexigens]